MNDLLDFLVEGLIGQKPDIKTSSEEGKEVYTLSVPKDKIAILIGKLGRTARAIRTVARVAARKKDRQVWIKIEEF